MAKKKFSNRVDLKLIKALPQEKLKVRRVDDVPAPEFGDGYTVIVKGMTAADRHILGELNGRRLQHFYTPAENDTPAAEFLYSSQCIMAALCAIDDEGKLVFGETPREAISTVSGLPSRYTDLISRIVVKALELSSGGADVEDAEAIDDAEKN